jgi:molybdate transport system permease protein
MTFDSTDWDALKLSLLVASFSTAIVAIIGLIVGYLLATRSFRGRLFVEIVCLLPLVLPPSVVGYYLLLFLGRNGPVGWFTNEYFDFSLLFSWQGAVIASSVVAFPLMVRVAQSVVSGVDRAAIEASYMLGYSELETAFRVVLPLSKRGLYAGVVLVFARSLGEFGATLMVAGNIPGRTATMPLAIYGYAASGEWERAGSLVMLLTVVSASFLLLVRRFEGKMM